MIAAAATAAIATYLIARKRSKSQTEELSTAPVTPGDKHLTNVFAKAKKYNM